MVAFNRCPGCGLRMGQRKEPGGLYRCRKCKSVLLHEKKGSDSLFMLKPDSAGNPNLLTIPRV